MSKQVQWCLNALLNFSKPCI